jgi:putative peptidoglycan lipid II flippase
LQREMPLEVRALWMAWAVLLAGVLQLTAQLPVLRRLGYQPPPRIRPLGPGVRDVLTRMGPAALGAAVTQINVLLDRILALWAGEYGPAALSFSERLIYLPLGLFATALGTILLPEFSGQAHRKDTEGMTRTLSQSLRGILFLMLPASLGLAALAGPIVRLVYARGEFDDLSVLLTARALVCYAPGLVIFSLVKVLVPVFYAHGNTRTPVRIGIAAVGGNILLNILFILLLPEGWKHAGLALGTVISETAQVLVLAGVMHRRLLPLPLRPFRQSLLRVLAACAPMLLTARVVLHLLAHGSLFIAVLASIVSAGAVYLLAARLLRCPELREFRHH